MQAKNSLRACVMGFPVTHSLSPKLHGFWLKKYKIDGSYTARPVPPEKLRQALGDLAAEGFVGCNLTLPLKEEALPLMDKLDETCIKAGAVNTVVIREGKMTGYNSDGFGFLESLKAQYPAWDSRRIVVLGTGGAARGIVAALQGVGARKFMLVNRTREKAEKLASDLRLENADIVSWQNRTTALEGATMLINCSSLGMPGQPALELDIFALPTAAVVCDIVYRPLRTPLVEKAASRGNPVVEGLPMLLHQGRLGFREWFGIDPAVTTDLQDEISRNVA